MKIILRITPPRSKPLPYVLLFSLVVIPVVIKSTNAPQSIGRVLSSGPVSIEGRVESKSLSDDPDASSLVIFNGNKINVQTGIALIELDENSGVVGICGNASVSVIHSKTSMMYGLQSGTLSVETTSSTLDRVLTPDFTVEWQPISPGAKKRGVVRVGTRGELCLQNIEGNVRVTDVLNGGFLQIPVGASILARAGGLEFAPVVRGLDCGCSPPLIYSVENVPDIPREGRVSQNNGEVHPRLKIDREIDRPSTDPPEDRRSQGTSPLPAAIPISTPNPAQSPSEVSKSVTTETGMESDVKALTGFRTSTISANPSAKASNKPSVFRAFGHKIKSFFQKIFFIKRTENPAATS